MNNRNLCAVLVMGLVLGAVAYAVPVSHTITFSNVDWTSGGGASVEGPGFGTITITGVGGIPVRSAL